MEDGEEMEQKFTALLSVSESEEEGEAQNAHICEVCGTYFETRRGLSSHARSHLRQLGVCVSESSGAPISLLYELITERDGKLPFSPKHPPTPSTTPKLSTTPKPSTTFKTKTPNKLLTKLSPTNKSGTKKISATKLKIKLGEFVKRQTFGSSALGRNASTPSSSAPLVNNIKPPKAPPPTLSPAPPQDSTSFLDSPSSSPALPSQPVVTKQEPDSLIDLMDVPGVSPHFDAHVCELCGAWFETRKGLASHSRAHLRQFGVDMECKAPPIQVLHDLLQKEVESLGQNADTVLTCAPPMSHMSPPRAPPISHMSPPRAPPISHMSPPRAPPISHMSPPRAPPISHMSPPRAPPISHMSPPPAKKKKSSLTEGKTLQEVKEACCEFCGDAFKSTQSLASHARWHLRQLGLTEWGGMPMAMLRELMAQRGCTRLPKPPHSKSSSPTKRPSATLTNPSPLLPTKPLPVATPPSSPGPSPIRVPKARKGSRMVKQKVLSEDSTQIHPAAPALQNVTVPAANPPPAAANQISSAGWQEEVGVAEMVQCDYCSDLFESRKALSCHARAHLRQMGVKWEQYASPIDTLQELVIREGRGQSSESRKSFMPSPVEFTFRERTEHLESPGTGGTSPASATCELCGFDFENRKALASHARAHLRQQGEQWGSSQSPIEALSQWMSREPEKVKQLHQLYLQGALPHIRKQRRISSPISPSDTDPARSGVSRPAPTGRETKSGMGHSFTSHRKFSSHHHIPNTTNDLTHRVKGSENGPKPLRPRAEGAEPLKRVGNAPSLVPPPPETSLVKVVGKMYLLKCRFCELVFRGPLSIQEDWLIHLRHHILNPTSTPTAPPTDRPQLIGQAV
ncbi:protein Wiz [Trichomycterus rosablanca]|uniref:protein Wiz n=1 Tax=Trichomycterus rosablanca TaxID=2290929 RepID=UPI002F35F421